jgi:hypothetical protein
VLQFKFFTFYLALFVMQDPVAVGANRNTLFDFLKYFFVRPCRDKRIDVSLWRRPVNVVKVNDRLMLYAATLAMK